MSTSQKKSVIIYLIVAASIIIAATIPTYVPKSTLVIFSPLRGAGGALYYRLKQTDFDGKTETFNSQQVAVDVTECAVKVFPNPVGNTLHVPYVAEQDGEVTLQVYDVIGKLVKDKIVTATKGNNKFTIDLSTVAQGMYVLRVKGGGEGA